MLTERWNRTNDRAPARQNDKDNAAGERLNRAKRTGQVEPARVNPLVPVPPLGTGNAQGTAESISLQSFHRRVSTARTMGANMGVAIEGLKPTTTISLAECKFITESDTCATSALNPSSAIFQVLSSNHRALRLCGWNAAAHRDGALPAPLPKSTDRRLRASRPRSFGFRIRFVFPVCHSFPILWCHNI